MAYFSDLSQYEYSRHLNRHGEELFNVGWLERRAPYQQGDVQPELVAKLLVLCKWPVNRYRGWHGCHFCTEYPVRVIDSDGEFCLGDGEIHISGIDRKSRYVAPNLIYHYVVAHRYLPPREFLEAAREMNLPAPGVIWANESIESFQVGRSSMSALSSSLLHLSGRGKRVSPDVRAVILDAVNELEKASKLPDVEAQKNAAYVAEQLKLALAKI